MSGVAALQRASARCNVKALIRASLRLIGPGIGRATAGSMRALSRRYWHWWGVLGALAMGAFDLVLIEAGVGMDITLVIAMYTATIAALGYAVGRLLQARARAKEDADLIKQQLVEIEESRRAAIENEKLAALGRLAAGVAHEVRNPLGVIRASAKMVQEGFQADEDNFRACNFIVEETDRLDQLIGSLLAYARPAKLDLHPVTVRQVIDHALALAADKVDNVELTLADDEVAIDADPHLLPQVVLGLLVNAAEAVGSGGAIGIRVGEGGGRVHVEVADSGPGVEHDDAEKIFEPFFTTKDTGTGLGLPMAARIVQAHGGTLALVPNAGLGADGRGACFRLAMPRAGAA